MLAVTYYQAKHDLNEIRSTVARWQNISDGGFPDFPPTDPRSGSSTVWTSAEVGFFILMTDYEKYKSRLKNLINYILRMQHLEENGSTQVSDGGFGFRLDDPSDANATALCLLLLADYYQHGGVSEPEKRAYIRAMASARDWLLKAMKSSGVVTSGENGPARAFDTCFANLALMASDNISSLYHPDVRRNFELALPFLAKSKKLEGWGAILRAKEDPLGTKADAIGTSYIIYLLQRMQEAGIISREGLEERTDYDKRLMNYQTPKKKWVINELQSEVEAASWSLVTVLKGKDLSSENDIQKAVKYLHNTYQSKLGWPLNPGQSPAVWVTCFATYALSEYVKSGPGPKKRIFIAHGHSELTEKVKEKLNEWGYEGIVQEDESFAGSPVLFEKFEEYANSVDYAIVIYDEKDRSQSSESMNIEAGYLRRVLGGKKFTMIQGNMSIPSEFEGYLRIVVDKEGKWEEKLKGSLVRAVMVPV